MLLVNAPGNQSAVYAQLEHSAWHGCTIADLVFPSFLFVVGITTTISLASMRDRDDAAVLARICRRAAILFVVGLLLNWFPFYQSGDVSWAGHDGLLGRLLARLLLLRIPGVMQRIAIAYLAAAVLARRASSRTLVATTVVLLIGYWMLLTVVPVPGEGVRGSAVLGQPSRTIVAHADRALFDWTRWGLGNHLWDAARTWDPEGALSALPAIATVLLGVLCGRWTMADQRRRIQTLVITGVVAIGVGWSWGLLFPLNKSLWTSSYVLFTAGIAAVVLGALSLIVDQATVPRWAQPLIIFGENPLIAYAGSEITRRILHSSIKIRVASGRIGFDEWMTQQFEHIGLSNKAASLAWSLLFVAAWWLVLARLSRRRLLVSA